MRSLLWFIIPKDHRLARCEAIDLVDLRGEALITFQQTTRCSAPFCEVGSLRYH